MASGQNKNQWAWVFVCSGALVILLVVLSIVSRQKICVWYYIRVLRTGNEEAKARAAVILGDMRALESIESLTAYLEATIPIVSGPGSIIVSTGEAGVEGYYFGPVPVSNSPPPSLILQPLHPATKALISLGPKS